jgi:hypothetical protein
VVVAVGWAKTPAFALPGALLVWPFVADAGVALLYGALAALGAAIAFFLIFRRAVPG